MTPFYEDVGAKVAATLASALFLGLLGWLYGSIKDMWGEFSRFRKAMLVLLDERRAELWNRIDKSTSGTTPEQARSFYDLMARKDRIDRIRDSEWKAAGCPKEPLRRGME